MPKRILFLLFVSCGLSTLSSAQETITITTYYPSPYGVYNEMRLFPHSPVTTSCNSGQEGLMYSDDFDRTLKVCQCENSLNCAWQSVGGAGYWQLSGNNLSPTDINYNVGIGKADPGAKLDVAGRIWQTNTGESVFLGEGAGQNDDLTNNQNTFVGYRAGYKNTSGYWNTFLGYLAGYNNTDGGRNIFLGSEAGYNNTSGSYNIFLGNYTGFHNKGSGNVFIGDRAGLNETGSNKLYIDNSSTNLPHSCPLKI